MAAATRSAARKLWIQNAPLTRAPSALALDGTSADEEQEGVVGRLVRAMAHVVGTELRRAIQEGDDKRRENRTMVVVVDGRTEEITFNANEALFDQALKWLQRRASGENDNTATNGGLNNHLSLIGGGVSADLNDALDIAGAIANEMRLSLL